MSNNGDLREKEISLNKVFTFPRDISTHQVDGKHLLISPSRANWLVFDESEHEVFKLLASGKSIAQAIRATATTIPSGIEVIKRVIIQLEEKQFYRNARATDQEILTGATVYLTRGCNLRCKTCYLSASTAAPDECEYEDWIRFLDAFKEIGGEVVTFAGGEPLKYTDCIDIVRHAKELGLQIVLLTNGTRITHVNARTFGETCDEIQVSIDGPNAETNDLIRGKGTFRKIIRALKELSPHPSRLSIAMTPTRETMPAFKAGLAEFVRWVRNTIRGDILFRITPRLLEGRNLRCMSQQEQDDFYREVEQLSSDCIETAHLDKLDSAALVPNLRLPSCRYGASFSVWWNGDVKPCGFAETAEPHANIRTQSVATITAWLEKLYCSTRVEQMEPCRTCDLRYLCGGTCRLENAKRQGSMITSCCDAKFRDAFYSRLVRINQWTFEPITE